MQQMSMVMDLGQEGVGLTRGRGAQHHHLFGERGKGEGEMNNAHRDGGREEEI